MNAKVLIAHGNALMADVLREVLEREGCRVTTASDGHRALGLALSDEYDLLLIDRDLPGLDGERVVEALQARGSFTPVIATCADRVWRPAMIGIFGALPIPFEEEALIAAAEAALSGDRERLQEATLAPQAPAQPLIPGSPNLRRRQALRARTASLPVKAAVRALPAAPVRRRILLIDADPATLERHRKALVASGYEVTAIRQGDEGFERGMMEAFDMIVTDLWLPGLDGFDLIAGLKRGGAETAVVVATAYLRKDMVAELRGLGVRRVLIKPFPEAALTRCALSTVRA